ncbi:hypothetical protein CAG60_01680 [Vibrio sp. V33_P6A3T137]|uniref:hypothetical protein n=1 Tax=Vibrio sp. V33_P6A3T137 TaxID=1938685 RepID=UPI0013735DE2|nr:hypothetical protein [Vibrio sp. V33_P6A3T137]NAW77596.1 hypothetical protein [Vibrio sp. V33_P6A3T137]
MQKQIITSAIALTLFGCGGGESGNSGNPTPPVKNYTIDFLGTDLQATTGNCQIFGYGPEKENGERERVIAFKTQPSTSRYEVFIHNADGTVRQHFRGSDLNTQQLRFAQNKIPNDGYLSFAYFQSRAGTDSADITTFAKSVLPDSFSIETRVDRRADSCLGPSSINPQEIEVTGYIERLPGVSHLLSGFNAPYQNLADITAFYQQNNPDTNPIKFNSQRRPLLAINYETDIDGKAIKALMGFKFTPFSQPIGTSGEPLKLTPIVEKDNRWYPPQDFSIENAFLFVNGKQVLPSANYAYLWQPLIENNTVIHNKFSYSESIGDNNYYLYLQGKQDANGNPLYWGMQHVAQGTTNRGASINANEQLNLNQLPPAEVPILDTCKADSTRQCLLINTNNLPSHAGIQRAVLTANSISSPFSLKQVFYTTIQDELPILLFNRSGLDTGLDKNTANSSISLLISDSKSVQEAFLYQHQTFEPERLSDLNIDYLPLLKNIAAQQDQQDLLKRQPYTWVWLEE